ncbi:809_t:CDS:1, partial [Gigaspora rosea]
EDLNNALYVIYNVKQKTVDVPRNSSNLNENFIKHIQSLNDSEKRCNKT